MKDYIIFGSELLAQIPSWPLPGHWSDTRRVLSRSTSKLSWSHSCQLRLMSPSISRTRGAFCGLMSPSASIGPEVHSAASCHPAHQSDQRCILRPHVTQRISRTRGAFYGLTPVGESSQTDSLELLVESHCSINSDFQM